MTSVLVPTYHVLDDGRDLLTGGRPAPDGETEVLTLKLGPFLHRLLRRLSYHPSTQCETHDSVVRDVWGTTTDLEEDRWRKDDRQGVGGSR